VGNEASAFVKETGLEMVTIDKKASTAFYRSKNKEFEASNSGNIVAGCSSSGIVGQAASYGYGADRWSQKIGNQSTGTCTTGNGEYPFGAENLRLPVQL
jgi:hypothetical protein